VLFFLSSCDHLRDLPSFPTRRSSDLLKPNRDACFVPNGFARRDGIDHQIHRNTLYKFAPRDLGAVWRKDGTPLRRTSVAVIRVRSEEHTSELQSRENLVCRLLLEKKK